MNAENVSALLPGNRPEPPEELNEEQAELWTLIVSTKPVEWFSEDVLPLLAAYCKAVYEHRRMSKALGSLDPVTKEYRDLAKTIQSQGTMMKTLATSMRLTPQSRYTPMAAATAGRRVAKKKPWED